MGTLRKDKALEQILDQAWRAQNTRSGSQNPEVSPTNAGVGRKAVSSKAFSFPTPVCSPASDPLRVGLGGCWFPSLDLRDKWLFYQQKWAYLGYQRIAIQGLQGKASPTTKGEKCYFMEKKREVGRGCFE